MADPFENLGDGFHNAARWASEMPDDWPVALIKLIDALKNYIRSDEAIAKDLLQEEGGITREEYDRGMAELEPMRALLAKLEAHGISPDLHGLIKRQCST